jgi:hypothetical protein
MIWLLNPIEAIKKAEEEQKLGHSVVILLVASILLGITVAIGFMRVLSFIPIMEEMPFGGFSALGAGIAALGVFLIVFIGGLFLGWVLKLTFTILGGDGGYFEGLTVISYSLLPLSVGTVIFSVFTYVPIIGGIVSFAAIAVFSAIAYATLYRASKELFHTDMITAFIGVSVIAAIMIISLYASLFSTLLGLQSLIPGMGFP